MQEQENSGVMGEASETNFTDAAPLYIPETTAYWSKAPYAWSTSLRTDSKNRVAPPLLTSSKCSDAVYRLFHNTYTSRVGDMDPYQPNFLLSVVTESCSHPAGLNALYAQPWMYAGPGLGNLDECPLQTCIAGGRETDTITFAGVCMLPECSAYDLAADDFVSVASRQLDLATIPDVTPFETVELGREYLSILGRIAELNKFLKTGWTCGAFIVPFEPWPFGVPYVCMCILLLVLVAIGTTRKTRKQRRGSCCHKADEESTDETVAFLSSRRPSNESNLSNVVPDQEALVTSPPANEVDAGALEHSGDEENTFWSAFDVSKHLRRLVSPAKEHFDTACLDGLRTGSIFWIMLGHVMAIQSSRGAGYANPSNFLPPAGITTTLAGQIFFSSRFAVDTFLTISGFLVVYVLCQKLPLDRDGATATKSFWRDVLVRYYVNLPALVVTRILRILPLYAMCLGFYTQIAPHLGSGPFWHQWITLLKPCHDSIWTNFLFVNNFLPFDTPTTDTCFYHSWYLAVDMQLFVVAPLLVFWYQTFPREGRIATAVLFSASVSITAYLSYTQRWSSATFDGAAVDRYDMEAYAKPHVRSQSYLAGMFVAMLLQTKKASAEAGQQWREPYTWKHRSVMILTLAAMFAVTFGTVTGAYARRPCTYIEDPQTSDCGSVWSPTTTFLYASFSRTVWSVGVAVLIHLCVGRGVSVCEGNLVASVLTWRCWVPLSQLSFGAYLVHPIVIYVWQLGDREKQVFRLLTFGMDYLSVCLVSYVASFVGAIFVEMPCATMWKQYSAKRCHSHQHDTSVRNGTGRVEQSKLLQAVAKASGNYGSC